MKKIVRWVVEEWESDDGSSSTEFETKVAAMKHAIELQKQDLWGIRRIKVWRKELIDDKPKQNPITKVLW